MTILQEHKPSVSSRFFGVITLLGMFLTFYFSAKQGVLLFDARPWEFLVAVFLATCTAVPIFLLIWVLDRNEPEPLLSLMGNFFWGAFVATAISMAFNEYFGAYVSDFVDAQVAHVLTVMFSAPFIEELTKGCAVILLFFLYRDEFNNILDGIVYGAVIGLGFAWFENILYYMKPFLDANPETGFTQMMDIFYTRGIISAGGGSHASYTALTGLGLGAARQFPQSFWRFLIIPFCLLLSMFAHFLWNAGSGLVVAEYTATGWSTTMGTIWATVFIQLPFVLLLIFCVVRMWSYEGNIINQYLESEDASIITAEERSKLTPTVQRSMRNVRALFSTPWATWRHSYTLRHLYVDLAFAKWHHDRDKRITWPPEQDKNIVELRAAIVAHKKKV